MNYVTHISVLPMPLNNSFVVTLEYNDGTLPCAAIEYYWGSEIDWTGLTYVRARHALLLNVVGQ